MLSKRELAKIRQRFEAGGADKPLRIEGDHLKDEGQTISLGWKVMSAEGHGLKIGDGGKEFPVVYATGTTFDAANFLAHLPVDVANMLADLESYHLILDGLLDDNEHAIRIAKHLVAQAVEEEKGTES